MAHGLVEAKTAAVEEDLVDVGGADATVDATDTLVAHNDAHAVNRAAVVVRLVALVLELALQLHAIKGGEGRGVSWDGSRRARRLWRLRIYRILTVSKGWVAVTAPQAAMPPAMKALQREVVSTRKR